jgi:hypothetical protein
MENHRNKFLILIIILIAAAGVIFMSQKMHTNSDSYVPIVAEAEEESKETSEISPDGKMTLSMKSEKVETGTRYSFSIKESESNISHEIYTMTAPAESIFTIPANTFSPDNKYVFLKESNGKQANYFVLSVNSSSNSQNSLDISPLFVAKHPDLTVTDMTGWGGINLIVFNTDKVNGGVGPSFWFDVPSKSFIQLSNRFN